MINVQNQRLIKEYVESRTAVNVTFRQCVRDTCVEVTLPFNAGKCTIRVYPEDENDVPLLKNIIMRTISEAWKELLKK